MCRPAHCVEGCAPCRSRMCAISSPKRSIVPGHAGGHEGGVPGWRASWAVWPWLLSLRGACLDDQVQYSQSSWTCRPCRKADTAIPVFHMGSLHFSCTSRLLRFSRMSRGLFQVSCVSRKGLVHSSCMSRERPFSLFLRE